MAKITYTLRLVEGGVIEVKVGRHREYISLLHKDKGQIYDAVKYALISKDAYFGQVRLTEDLHELIWRHI